jgi:Ca2+-binding EF-hand superfamily protein
MLLAPLLLSLAPAAAQPAPAPLAPAAAAPAYTTRRGGRLFISPMGEPFRPSGREDDTLADWFNQADKNHDGRLTLDEMQQDADRFFATLDTGHDGEIDPDDITRYETVVAPEITSGSSFGLMAAMESGGEGREGHHGGGGHRGFFRGADNDPHQGAGRFGLLDLPEPVVSADTNFNRGVSQAEFRQAAAQRFMALDLDHHGYLTLSGLATIRPAPPAAPKAPEKSREVDESALPNSG